MNYFIKLDQTLGLCLNKYEHSRISSAASKLFSLCPALLGQGLVEGHDHSPSTSLIVWTRSPLRWHSSLSRQNAFPFSKLNASGADPPPWGWHCARIKCRTGWTAPLALKETFNVSQGCRSQDYTPQYFKACGAGNNQHAAFLPRYMRARFVTRPGTGERIQIWRATPAPGMGMKWPIKKQELKNVPSAARHLI